MTNPVPVLSDDERIAQIRERQSYRSGWAYGNDIEFLLSQNTALREQLAVTTESFRQAAIEVLDHLNFDTTMVEVQQDADQIAVILRHHLSGPEAGKAGHD